MMPFIQHSEKNKTGHRLGFPGAGEGKGAGGGWGGIELFPTLCVVVVTQVYAFAKITEPHSEKK